MMVKTAVNPISKVQVVKINKSTNRKTKKNEENMKKIPVKYKSTNTTLVFTLLGTECIWMH